MHRNEVEKIFMIEDYQCPTNSLEEAFESASTADWFDSFEQRKFNWEDKSITNSYYELVTDMDNLSQNWVNKL